MNSTVLDYVDQTKADYEAWMAERYGEDWKNIKFVCMRGEGWSHLQLRS